MKTCYQFNKEGFYLGEATDYGTGLPNNTTYDAPSTAAQEEGFIPQWDGAAWVKAENHKGKQVWESGIETEWAKYGALPENVTLTPPPKTLEESKKAKKQSINKERDKKEQSSFLYDGSSFDTDQVSYMRLLGASQTAQSALASGQEFSVDWTLSDNSTRTMSAEDMLAIIPAFAMYSSSLHVRAKVMKDQVEAIVIADGTATLAEREAVAVAAVDAIIVSFA